jgi:hypothetical protein
MRKRTRDFARLARGLPILIVVLGSSMAQGQTGGPYDLSWSTIDGGGNSMSGGTYELNGTTGQPDAGELQGGTYRLGGGFWGGGARFTIDVPGRLDRARPIGIEPGRPNPFSGSTVIGFTIARPQRVELRVFDPMGRLVRTLLDENLSAGRNLVTWDGKDAQGHLVPNGVYPVRLTTADFKAVTKLVFLKN